MCGLTGFFNHRLDTDTAKSVLEDMTCRLAHRGPDSAGSFLENGVGLGFRRLSIIDLEGGHQPLFNEDRSVALLCNGEIFNAPALRAELLDRGHVFRTRTDVEVVLHLYEEIGLDLLDRLNGQFSFALYDRRRERLCLARDPVGINPLLYTEVEGTLVFASEAKSLLRFPGVARDLDLTALDQVISFPGVVAPRTIFRTIKSLQAGHYLVAESGGLRHERYWDLDYPRYDEPIEELAESVYVERLDTLLHQAVERRLQADVPVGFYLSGGMDSSLIGALIDRVSPRSRRHSFSVTFGVDEISEVDHQRVMAERLGTEHHEIFFDWSEIHQRLQTAIYHCETPLKETFDACALALSEAAKTAAVPVVLAGQGADELFCGYPGYRFDQLGPRHDRKDLETALEDDIRQRLWGDRKIFYEREQYALRDLKLALYAPHLAAALDAFACTHESPIDTARLACRHPLHQRSYLDFKLRLEEHLLSEHGDRMALAHSIEARYPFLDPAVIDFARRIPPGLKVKDLVEKHVLKEVARAYLPASIVDREKFGFQAPGSPYLLRQNIPWIEEFLDRDRIVAQGYFNPDTVERLKGLYRRPGFRLHPHLDIDLLMIVLTTNVLIDRFDVPNLDPSS